jgi:hypothetical protein
MKFKQLKNVVTSAAMIMLTLLTMTAYSATDLGSKLQVKQSFGGSPTFNITYAYDTDNAWQILSIFCSKKSGL